MNLNRQELLNCLDSVVPGLTKKDILEQSSCFVLANGEIWTFNEEVCCHRPCSLAEILTGALPAYPLLGTLRKVRDAEVKVTQKNGSLVFQDVGTIDKEANRQETRWRTSLRYQKEVLLPIGVVAKPTKWKKLPEQFSEAVTTVGGCALERSEYWAWTCVHLTARWVESSDGFQFCRWPLETGLTDNSLIRFSTLKPVLSLGLSEVSETPGWLHFRSESGLVVSCRSYLERFPDGTKLLDVQGEELVVPPSLDLSVKIAEIFSSDNAESNRIRVRLEKGKILLTATGASGTYEEVKRTKYEGPELSFSLPPEVLSGLLGHSQTWTVTKDKVRINGSGYVYVSALFRPEKKVKEEESED